MTFSRKWYLDEALHSFSRLMSVINHMTEGEVKAALDLEAQTRRRKSIIIRLIGRAARLAEIRTSEQLKEQYLDGHKQRANTGR